MRLMIIFTLIFRARNPSSLLNGCILSIVWNNCKWVLVSTDDGVLNTVDACTGWAAVENNVAMRNKIFIWK